MCKSWLQLAQGALATEVIYNLLSAVGGGGAPAMLQSKISGSKVGAFFHYNIKSGSKTVAICYHFRKNTDKKWEQSATTRPYNQ